MQLDARRLRGLAIRVMLVCLGLGAAIAAMAVLVAPGSVMFRACATFFLGSGAAVVSFPLSFLIGRPRTREAGFVSLAAVLASAFVAIAALWAEFFPFRLGFALWATAGWLLPLGCVLAFAAAMRREERHRVGAWALAGVGVASFVVLNAAAWLDVLAWRSSWWPSRSFWELLASGGLVALFGVFAAVALFDLPAWRARPLRWVGVAASVVGLAAGLVAVWSEEDLGREVAIWAGGVGLAVGHGNLLFAVSIVGWARWVRLVTVVLASSAIGVSCLVLAAEGGDRWLGEMLGRLIAALSIVATAGTLGTAVLGWMNRPMKERRSVEELAEVRATCPYCGARAAIAVGESSCPSCGLQFNLTLDYPACAACGYNLLGVRSESCPECGTLIPRG
ncbi:MAG: hypothetical protein AAF823_00020 [Planctomycetota bacterium]